MKKNRICVISGWTVNLLAEKPDGDIIISLDLGLTHTAVRLERESVILPDGKKIAIADMEKAAPNPQDCLSIAAGQPRKLYLFSETKGKYYKLFQPKPDMAPTLVINNATMHSIKGGGPWRDTEKKINSIRLKSGRCLDTCCGLGYSAQMLADKKNCTVTTCEVDADALKLASLNPWSKGLFDNQNITIMKKDLRTYLEECDDNEFSVIFHDPPTILQAGELYSENLYHSFAAKLRRDGVLYHYTGMPGAKQGKNYRKGIGKRLMNAGFTRVKECYGGLLARR